MVAIGVGIPGEGDGGMQDTCFIVHLLVLLEVFVYICLLGKYQNLEMTTTGNPGRT